MAKVRCLPSNSKAPKLDQEVPGKNRLAFNAGVLIFLNTIFVLNIG